MIGPRRSRASGDPLLRHLLRHAVGHRRVRAQRLRAARRRLHRVRARDAAPRSSTSCATCSASTTWAARCVWARTPAGSSPARWRTAYGADDIHERHRHRYEFNALYEQTLADPGLDDRRAGRPTASSSRSSNCRTTRGSSRCSSTPSSSRSPCARIRCLRASSRPATAHKRRRLAASTSARPRGGRADAWRPVILGATGPRRRRSSSAAARRCSHCRSLRHRERGARARSGRWPSRDIAARAGVPFIFKASFDKANRTSHPFLPRPGTRGRACASSAR